MKSRAVRLTLFLLFVAAVGVTAYLFWQGETRTRVEGEAARAHDERAIAVIRDIDRLRTAQQAYVAAGQDDQFWSGRVASTLADLRQSLERLRASSTSPASVSAIDSTLTILEDFEQMDRRAREHSRTGQHLLASDLIFGAGFELTAAGADAITEARHAERQAQDEVLAGVRGRQVYAVGSGAAAALLVVLLLLPVPRPSASAPEPRPETSAASTPADAGSDLGAALDDEWPVGDASRADSAAETPTVEFGFLASLCTDLARLSDTRALPALLERSATTLDATGIVLWIADPDGRELSPIVTHGYSPQVVTRLGTILRETENATASAFRTSLLQTVKADAVSNGAIAAPLITPAGCVGVMAAEVRHEGEQDAGKLAAATIVAAQLATLVGPPSARQAKAEATR